MMDNMNEENRRSVLPLMFRQVKASREAKEELRCQLFGITELSDDELTIVAAAGAPEEKELKNPNKDNRK